MIRLQIGKLSLLTHAIRKAPKVSACTAHPAVNLLVPTKFLGAVAFACALLTVPSRAHADSYALLIGIDHYLPPQSDPDLNNDLSGCINDVKTMRSLLKASGFAVDSAHMHILESPVDADKVGGNFIAGSHQPT